MQSREKPKVVLDSVVLVSAFLTGGLTAELFALCRERVKLYTAEDILQEIRRVLLEKVYITRLCPFLLKNGLFSFKIVRHVTTCVIV